MPVVFEAVRLGRVRPILKGDGSFSGKFECCLYWLVDPEPEFPFPDRRRTQMNAERGETTVTLSAAALGSRRRFATAVLAACGRAINYADNNEFAEATTRVIAAGWRAVAEPKPTPEPLRGCVVLEDGCRVPFDQLAPFLPPEDPAFWACLLESSLRDAV